MSVTSDLKTVLKNRIGALSSVAIVYGYEEQSISQWPAVIVLPSNLEGEFVSTAENRRSIGFDIMILFPTGQNVPKDSSEKPIEYAERIVSNVMDEIIDDLDQNSFNNAFADISDTDVTFLYADAADASWGYVDYEGGTARSVQITLLCYMDFQARSS